jgi:hypothetical protein
VSSALISQAMASHLVLEMVNDRLPVPELSETTPQLVALARLIELVQAIAWFWSLVRDSVEQTCPLASLGDEARPCQAAAENH